LISETKEEETPLLKFFDSEQLNSSDLSCFDHLRPKEQKKELIEQKEELIEQIDSQKKTNE